MSTHLNTIRLLGIILVISIAILSYQKLDAQNMDDFRLHSKTYEAIANQTNTLEHTPSITVGRTPGVMVFDSNPFNPNKIYVANFGSNTISVIDANNNTNIGTLKVGPSPDNMPVFSTYIPPPKLKTMAINNDKIYIDNFGSNTISVIDAKNYSNVKTIKVGNGYHNIEVWAPGGGFIKFPNYIYVASSGSWNISEINGYNQSNVRDIEVEKKPASIILLPSANFDPTGTSRPRIITTTEGPSNTISVIDAKNHSYIPVPMGFHSIANSLNKILVANHGDNTIKIDKKNNNTISVIDAKNYSNVKTIKVGNWPVFMYSSTNNIPPSNDQRIYVANYIDGTVSVIDGENYSNVKTIKVGNGPSYMISNPLTDTIYVSNALSNSISVIDGVSNKVVAGVTFNVSPFNSGDIVCNNLSAPTPLNQYFYLFSGSKCIAKPHKGFEFQSWQENLKGNSTQPIKSSSLSPSTIYDYVAGFSDSTARFFGIKSYLDDISKFFGIRSTEDEKALDITKFGSFTANFKALPPPIPAEYITTLFGIVAAAFVSSWLTPTVIAWRKTRNQAKKLDFYHNKVNNLYDKLDKKDIEELNGLRNNITDQYTKGKINNEQYGKLRDDVSIKYSEIFREDLDSLNNLSEADKEKKLGEIKKNIEDIHDKGKINNEQFTSLKNDISILYEEMFRKGIDSLKPSEKNVKEKLKAIENGFEDVYSKGDLTELHYNLLNKRITQYITDNIKK
jgi:YVTN family beta-propeller protein